MRAIVREQLQAGKTAEQIKEFFVSKYGEWVLLKPKTTGFSALLWILPYVVLVIGVIAALWFMRRWSTNKRQSVTPPAESSDVNAGIRANYCAKIFRSRILKTPAAARSCCASAAACETS